jgi:polyphosphate kinase
VAFRPIDKPDYYLNRNLSWLQFNRRVLEEAKDAQNPLLERVKFLAISASNLDEFFEVRIASLLQKIEDGLVDAEPDGRSPMDELSDIAAAVHEFAGEQHQCWRELLVPELGRHGIEIVGFSELNDEQSNFAEAYCGRELDPLLTPVTIDPAHPFPRVINKALCQALLLRRKRRAATTYMGVVTVPRVLPRLVRVPAGTDEYRYVSLADLVAHHATRMYRGYDILSEGAFRITRNSNLYLQEEESRSVLESVRAELHNRRRGDAVRLEIEADANEDIVSRLQTVFELSDWQVFRTPGVVNLSRLMHLYSGVNRPDLKYKPFVAREWVLPKGTTNAFDALKQKDTLLHHPFDSFGSVVSFLQKAAKDPDVLSIKQTLYRTSEESPVVDALVEAAQTKEVAVVVEVKARFDEASNIRWARHLEDAGVQVFHGLVGLKTHCKLTLIARREDGAVRRYAHLGTGNYNPVTAKLYTDLSLLTADETIANAVHDVFNFLTAYAEQPTYQPLQVAPLHLAEDIINLIEREAQHARSGRPARIIAKMNTLLDKTVVQSLYRASQAGVEIDLIVRGVCSLNPGIRGISDHIRVRSIVGRFLEHSRIFYFENGGNADLYLGSADWMPRNLYERVEVLFPIRNQLLRDRIRNEILAAYLADTSKVRLLKRGGTYVRSPQFQSKTGLSFNAQEFLIQVAEGKADLSSIPTNVRARRTRARKPVARAS